MTVPPATDQNPSSHQHDAACDDNALFLSGCEVPQRWRHQQRFTVLDLGVHDSCRLWATLVRLTRSSDGPTCLEYVALLEQLPSPALIDEHLHEIGLAAPRLARQLMAGWPGGAAGLHRIDFDERHDLPPGHRARVTIAIGEPIALLSRLRLVADAVFIDGRTRAAAHALRAQLAILPRLMAPGARLSVLIADHDVRQADAALQQRGFELEPTGCIAPGSLSASPPRLAPTAIAPTGDTSPAVQRVASLSPHRQPKAIWPSPPMPSRREAIIVGAGLAGCASAAVLAERGWGVTVLDASHDLLSAGGAQPRVADHPHFSGDDNRLARLSRHALWLGARWRPARTRLGRLQLAASEADWQLMARWCASGAIHPSVARCVDAREASAHTGLRLPHGGLWMPECDAVAPAALCQQWLGSSAKIDWQPGVVVSRLQREAGAWRLFGPDGSPLREAPVVILANAGGAQALAGLRWPLLQRTRGQSTRLESSAWQGLRSVLGGSAYACPLGGGDLLVGATADAASALIADPDADRSNLTRLQAMLSPPREPDESLEPDGEPRGQGKPGRLIEPGATSTPAGVGWRFAAPDHLPLIGALPDEPQIARNCAALSRNDRLALPTLPGLYGHFALGSRGLLWSMLGAEVLAAMIDGGVSPLEGDLLQAIDPSRFVRQRLRRQLPI